MRSVRPVLLFRSIRRTRASQLGHRVGKVVKRRLSVAFRGWSRRRLEDGGRVEVGAELPRPILPPRRHLVVAAPGGGRSLVLLNQETPLALPMDWSAPGIRVGRRLAALAVHYLDFLEAVGDEDFVAFSEDWISRVPPYQAGYWRDSWNSYGLSQRCMVWMQQLAERRGRLSRRDFEGIARATLRQLRFLERNLELDLGGNHLLKNLTALTWGGRFFRGRHPERWRGRAGRLLARELDEQVLADGVHHERSPAYHCQVFADLLECRHVVATGALRDQLGEVLGRMGQALVDLTHPDGRISLFNDGGLSMTRAPGVCMDAYERLLGQRPSPRPVFGLDEAGYYGLRQRDSLFLADAGRIGPDFLPAHGHGDVLAFEWTIDGKRIFVDFGVYEYGPGEWRARSRSTVSHNTVTVGDEDQCEFWSSFRVGRRPRRVTASFEPRADGFHLVGSHDGYHHLRGRPRHERSFDVAPDRAGVHDVVHGGAGQPVRARLLLHPECRVARTEGGARIQRDGLVVDLVTRAGVTIRDWWWCPDFGVRHDTRQIVLDYGPAPASGGFELSVSRT